MAAKTSKIPAKAKSKPKPKATSAPKSAKTKAPAARMSLVEAMSALEKAGTAQTRKTWLRHGAEEPLFGVLFSEFAKMKKRIGVDHDLACALWATGNLDAQILAVKIADPSRHSAADLDRWAGDVRWPMLVDYVAQLAAESPHARTMADAWVPLADEQRGRAGWTLVGVLALRDTATPDAWFQARLAELEKRIHTAPNIQRESMNRTLISIGGRSPALRDAAIATAKRLGKVEVDHGNTSCKTPEAKPYIEKMWDHAKAKGFATPAAQEQARESPRCRC